MTIRFGIKSVIIILLLIMLLPGSIQGSDICEPPPPGPPPDNADDNFSYNLSGSSISDFPLYVDSLSTIAVFENGNREKMTNLLGQFHRSHLVVGKNFYLENILSKVKMIIIPTGGLFGLEDSAHVKLLLEQFVARGGNLLVFAQQDSDDYDILPLPEGSLLQAYGWRNSQSCIRNSVYFSNTHPIFSSCTNEMVDAGLDGYFEAYPAGTQTWLKRNSNNKPALISYDYGMGKLVLTAMYSEWGASHGQASTQELKLVRDMITYFKNPRLPVPMINIDDNPTPEVTLNVKVENQETRTVSKVKLMVYTPGRTGILYETEQELLLNPESEDTIPLTLTLPEIQPADTGICHTLYELYDAEGNLVQEAMESDSGRFALFRSPETYTSEKSLNLWINVNKEILTMNETAEFTIFIENNTTETITLEDTYFDWNHYGNYPVGDITVPAGEQVQKTVISAVLGLGSRGIQTFWFNYKKTGDTKYKRVRKGVTRVNPNTQSRVKMVGGYSLKVNTPFSFEITSRDIENKYNFGDYSIRLFLEKRGDRLPSWPYYEFEGLATVYETTLNLSENGPFSHTGTYTPPEPLTPGRYRLGLEVIRPDDVTEKQSTYFYYHKTNVGMSAYLSPSPNQLIIGDTHTIKGHLVNTGAFPVDNGTCTLILESETGAAAFSKKITAITLTPGETKTYEESFVFNPPQAGIYRTKIRYEDESGNNKSISGYKRYRTGLVFLPSIEKKEYAFGETVVINTEITGIGNYLLTVSCEAAGFLQTRNIQMTPGNNRRVEQFEMPYSTHFNRNSLKFDFEIRSSEPGCNVKGICWDSAIRFITLKPVVLDGDAAFAKLSTIVGDPMELTVNIKGHSGFAVPVSGELTVKSPALGFEDIKAVTLSPLENNAHTLQVPLPGTTTAGTYPFEAIFTMNGQVLLEKRFSISVPEPGIKLDDPPAQVSAGIPFVFLLKNPGGKDGNYEYHSYIKDNKGKRIHEYTGTHAIKAGQETEIPVAIPANIKSGTYISYQKAKETHTGKEVTLNSQLQVTGISAVLDTYTLKENYFDNETVSGKAEITPGAGNIENGVLNALIVKYEEGESTELLLEAETYAFTLAKDSQNRLWVGTPTGVSLYDGTGWSHYESLPGGDPIGPVEAVVVGPGDTGYAAAAAGIVVIADGNVTLIPHPEFKEVDGCLLTVDTLSRVWCKYSYGEMGGEVLLYMNGIWEGVLEWSEGTIMIADGGEGVWIADWGFLQHVTPDNGAEEFFSGNSQLPDEPIQSIYRAADGTLWITAGEEYASGWRLMSFDTASGSPVLSTDYSDKPGYPVNGMVAVTGDNNGTIYGIGLEENWSCNIYRLQDDKLLKVGSQFYTNINADMKKTGFAAVDGTIYTNGTIGDSSLPGGDDDTVSGLLKIAASGGNGETIVWSATYPVNINNGTTGTVNLEPGTQFQAGFYTLETQLISSAQQLLADKPHTFTVRGTAVSVTLKGEPEYGLYIRKGADLSLEVNSFNNTTENKNNLSLSVKKISPTGTETQLTTRTLSLNQGESDARTILFNESETGTWKVVAKITEGTAVLSESEMMLEVAAPMVSTEIIIPGYAGDDAFDIKVKIANPGEIDVTAACQVPEIELDETLTLKPGEEKIIASTDTITTAKTYEVILGGDIERRETKTVQYGYVESFNMNVPAANREGKVSLGYGIANAGVLPFSDTVHAEIYAAGGTEPLYTVARRHNLYPGAGAVADTIQMQLTAGNYRLAYKTGRTAEQEAFFTVRPSGIGTLEYTGGRYPAGSNDITYRVTNSDTAAGHIPLTVTVGAGQPAAVILSENRSYYLEPGETVVDTVVCDFPQKGDYNLAITGPKLTASIENQLHVSDMMDAGATITVGAIEVNHIPVTVNITNSGYLAFEGTVVMAVDGPGSEEPVIVPGGETFVRTYGFETAALQPGDRELKVYLYDSAGNTVTQATAPVAVGSPGIALIDVPGDIAISAGSYAPVTLKMKNNGHLRGECILNVKAFDSLDREYDIALEPGEELEINDISVDTEADLPAGNYPCYYTLTGTGVIGGRVTGNFNIKVTGVDLSVEAALDRTHYNTGDTAQLTLRIDNETAADTPLEAIVNWGDFNERRRFNMSAGIKELVFEIPLDQKRETKIFYGIYHGGEGEGGKGIYLNDTYIHFRDTVAVETVKQVYEPGEALQAVFLSDQAGTLYVEAFDESRTLPVDTTASATFIVPENTPGGTYGISWRLEPADTAQPELSGSHRLDVAGLVVKVVRARLEKGNYQPGETIKAGFLLEANRDETLELHVWVDTPDEQWTKLGETAVTVSADSHTESHVAHEFTTTEAGPHEFIYGLYREGKLIASGRMVFDVGHAAVLGIVTGQPNYAGGNEDVDIKVGHLGEGNAQLQLHLDGELVEERSVLLKGMGSTEITLSSSQVNGGSHILKAELVKDGLTSVKQTSFKYGVNLPDLTLKLKEHHVEGLNYTYTITVSNSGKSESAATTFAFKDDDETVEIVPVPALQPGAGHDAVFLWNGSGKAGRHDFRFKADTGETVKEFNEGNNVLVYVEAIPEMYHRLEVEPLVWPANSDITIISR
ncbi:MAG: hypothetical protein GY757_28390, partial [bacterium]|nr:hypothetical protein [bacterium]